MRFLSAAALLTALVSGINGSVIPEAHIGTFDTFTDTKCGHGGKGITVTDKNSQGTLSSDIHSVKAYIPGCALVIWTRGGMWYPLVIRPGDHECHELDGPGRSWNISCP
ncbi:hypothetical protein NQ176_g1516 [Zarea fungicola]|uniref:Uncharacterized protein n=1 Tax=Zarea fungicola TaxID=93591 RepID=A0ACC1NSD4_9HYPO|nr:hypothetical protein NQ176_g1516 [Lecanicillium fungicola]